MSVRAVRVDSLTAESLRDAAERLLLDASRSGDRQAFEALYTRYAGAVRSLCERRIGDRSRAEDLVQETFLRAFTHMARFKKGRRLWPWLSTIARNLCIDELRVRSRWSLMPNGDALNVVNLNGSPDLTSDEVMARHESARVRNALDTLRSRDRRVLLQRAEGLSYEKIAEAEGTTVDTLRNAAFRARASVRRILDGDGRVQLRGVVLGLALVVRLHLRRVRTRAAQVLNFGSTLSGVGPAADGAVAALLGLAAIAATVFAPGGATPKEDLRRSEAQRIVSAVDQRSAHGLFAPLATLISDHMNKSVSDGDHGLVRTSVETKPPHHGAPGPSAATYRLQVWGADGRMLHEENTGLECGGQGADVLPQDGPIRAIC